MGRLTQSVGQKADEPQEKKVHYGVEMVIGPDYCKVQIVLPAAQQEIHQDYVDALRNNNHSE